MFAPNAAKTSWTKGSHTPVSKVRLSAACCPGLMKISTSR